MKFPLLSSIMKKWHLAVKIAPIIASILILKFIFHYLEFEIMSLNALFTSLIAAAIFLIGFLINGVISDYKESEKLPGELASSIEAIYDEAYILHKNKKSRITKEFLVFHKNFLKSLNRWFYREERTKNMIEKLHLMDNYFAKFDDMMKPNFLVRMKTEQNNIRKMILRIDSIRDLSFIQSAYAIVEALTVFLVAGLLILKIDPFYEAMFFTFLVSFLVVYMIFLIKDLDNPFDYSRNGENGTEVSLKPVSDLTKRLVNKKI